MNATNPVATSRSASASAEGSAYGGIFAPASTDSALWARAAPSGSGLVDVVVSAGTHAVLTYIGPYALMRFACDWLYGEWLPRSQREPSGEPLVEEYFNNPRDTPPAELRTEIWLPLRPA